MKWVKGIGATAIVSLLAVLVGWGLLGAVAFFKAGGSRKEADGGRQQVPPPPRPKPPIALSRATTEVRSKRSESDKIERLITLLNGLTGASFVRNGKTYRVDEAVAHMRMKWDWKKDRIKTVDDFIRIIASKSSVSGKPYLIRLADGAEMPAEEWFRQQLRRMEP